MWIIINKKLIEGYIQGRCLYTYGLFNYKSKISYWNYFLNKTNTQDTVSYYRYYFICG